MDFTHYWIIELFLREDSSHNFANIKFSVFIKYKMKTSIHKNLVLIVTENGNKPFVYGETNIGVEDLVSDEFEDYDEDYDEDSEEEYVQRPQRPRGNFNYESLVDIGGFNNINLISVKDLGVLYFLDDQGTIYFIRNRESLFPINRLDIDLDFSIRAGWSCDVDRG